MARPIWLKLAYAVTALFALGWSAVLIYSLVDGNADHAPWAAASIAAAVLLAAGLWMTATHPRVSMAAVVLGGAVLAVTAVWLVIPPLAAVAVVVYGLLRARRTARGGDKPEPVGGVRAG
jgi:hypothetical protein